MKGMKLLPIIAISLFLMGVIGTNLLAYAKSDVPDDETDTESVEDDDSSESEDSEEEDNTTYSWEEPSIPAFLENYMDSTWWGADTICVVYGKPYYFGYDEYGRTSVIYSTDELLCEDPTLTYDSVGSAFKTKFRINTAYTSMVVDFADQNSVNKLKNLVPKFDCVNRLKKDYFSEVGNMVMYHLDIDCPKANNSHTDNIRKWLVHLLNESLDNEEDVPYPNSLAIGYTKRNHSDWKYIGNIRDIEAIEKFASERYFVLKKSEYGTDPQDYPSYLFFDLSLRLVSTNGRYYSYQKQTHEYNGGLHGFYTESIVSFDTKANEEINWDFLFKSGNEERIISLFYNVVKNDHGYNEWENTNSIAEIKEHFEMECSGLCNGNIILPKPGLTAKGVTFSYQPYAISCFAAGCFHFTIPYKDLKPFMTDKAKRLLNL